MTIEVLSELFVAATNAKTAAEQASFQAQKAVLAADGVLDTLYRLLAEARKAEDAERDPGTVEREQYADFLSRSERGET